MQDVIQGWSRSRALRTSFRKTLTLKMLKQECENILNLSQRRDPVLIAAIAAEYEKLYKNYRAKT
jgi:hypothetical protein